MNIIRIYISNLTTMVTTRRGYEIGSRYIEKKVIECVLGTFNIKEIHRSILKKM